MSETIHIDALRQGTMSLDISKLAEALSKAQAVIEGAKEDSANSFFKSKYADLSSVWAACRKALSDNGLAVIQVVEQSDQGRLNLNTFLVHNSGQWIKSSLPLLLKEQSPQALGSAITYNRRYALAAIVGVCPDDDDGEAAMKGHPRQNPRGFNEPEQKTEPHFIKPEQVKIIEDLIGDDNALRERVQAHYQVIGFQNLMRKDFDQAVELLKKKKATK